MSPSTQGVSRAAVSTVLRGAYGVRDLSEKRVEESKEALVERIEGRHEPQSALVQPTLMIRRTTGPAPDAG